MATSRIDGVCDIAPPFWFETHYDVEQVYDWMERNWHISIVLALTYIVAIFSTQHFMRNKRPWDLRSPLILWNTVLAVFSIAGCVRTVEPLYYVVATYGFKASTCRSPFYCPQMKFWCIVFCLSKVPELMDSAFIVLRKRPLIFLHWYHHATVLVYTWFTTHDMTASGRWFFVMNFGVHAVMYTYYALMAARVKVHRGFAACVTSLQIAQMVMGIAIGAINFSVKWRGEVCHQTYTNLVTCMLMYATYFALFAMFFYKTYFRGSLTPCTTGCMTNGADKSALTQDPPSNGSHVNIYINGYYPMHHQKEI